MARRASTRTAEPLVLYSTGTWLAVKIAEQFYRDVHFVWCTPDFDSNSAWTPRKTTPPTSCPSDIYHSLWEEVAAGDLHSAKVETNRLGILKGATEKLRERAITRQQKQDIAATVAGAHVRDFRPVLFVIPFHGVARMAKPVPVAKRAHPLSTEYIIDALPRRCFDLIELRR